jgi:hypothetical protein
MVTDPDHLVNSSMYPRRTMVPSLSKPELTSLGLLKPSNPDPRNQVSASAVPRSPDQLHPDLPEKKLLRKSLRFRPKWRKCLLQLIWPLSRECCEKTETDMSQPGIVVGGKHSRNEPVEQLLYSYWEHLQYGM